MIRAMPPVLSRPLAWILAVSLFLTVERKTTLDNVARVYPEWSPWRRRGLAFRAYLEATRSLIEFLQSRRYSDEEMVRRMIVEERDVEMFARVFAEGRGALILTGHYGNWAWMARRAQAAGYPVAALSKTPKDPALAKRFREIQGFTTIEFGDTRALIRWLRAGNVLAILMDQEPLRRNEGAVVPLLGQPTLTHTGPFRLARMTGAPMFTAFPRRTGHGRHRVVVESFDPSPDPDLERALAEDAARFNTRLEKMIREAPEEWLWMYARWRRLDRIRAREDAAAAKT